MEKQMSEKRTWEEFRNSGILWWGNMILHTFGWAITFNYDEKGNLTEVYPARVKFRGFDNKSDERGFIRVSEFMKENAEQLLKEAKDEE
jgi:hypothetical protein